MRRNIMPLILGSERALFDRYIVEAELTVDDFKIAKERDAPGATAALAESGLSRGHDSD
jgi:hypothetical protein